MAANATRWARASMTRGPAFATVAHRLVKEKQTYLRIEAATGVPWFVVAVIHEREASQNFAKSIAQGDPWDHKSVHVPAGRGPFKSWYDAAIDALVNCAPHAAQWKDWSPGGTMALLEQYNGLGYYAKDRPSPYIWAGTNQYVSGKYVRDGVYDPNTVDTQLGCAGLILAMQAEDPSIKFGDVAHEDTHVVTEQHPAAPAQAAPAEIKKPAKPVDIHASTGSFLNTIYTAIQGFLKRKS